MRAGHRSLFRAAAWVGGLVLVAVVVHQVGPRTVAETFTRVGARILWLVAAYAAATVASAFPWRLLMSNGSRPTYAGAVSSRFAASGLNAFLPLVGAGELTRLFWLRRSAWSEGAAAILLDRMLFGVASVVALIAGALATWFSPGMPSGFVSAAFGSALILVAMLVAILWVARTGRAAALMRRLGARESWGRVDVMFGALLAAPKQRLLQGLGWHLVGRALAALEIYCALRALGVDVGPAPLLVLAAVPIALSVVGAVVPGQLGLQEGTQAVVAAALGLGAGAGLSLALLQRARQIIFLPVTALLLSTFPHRHTPGEEERP